jgi:hypothetical protein
MYSLVRTLTAAALAASAVAATAGSAQAATGVPLGITSFADLVVDQAHGHVFISDGTSQVLVRDLDGAAVTAVTGLDHPAGMTLSDDGSMLYVAVRDAQLVTIATTDLTTGALPVGAGSCPVDVATASGLLWVSNACTDSGQIDAVDPVSGMVTAGLRTNVYVPRLVAAPQLPDTLLWYSEGLSPGTLHAEDVTTSPTPALSERASAQVGSNTRDAAISADGSRVITASGAPYEHPVFLTSDLSSDGSYGADSYPNAVAVRSDGMVAGGISGWYSPDVYVYPAGSRTLFRSYEFGGTSNELVTRGLAFGETRLYAVTGDLYSNSNYRLQVITPRAAASVTVKTDKKTYDFNQKATVSVRLSAGAASQRQVTVYAQENGGSPRLVGTGTVPVGGVLTLTRKVTIATTFTAEYAGDADTDAATGTATPVKVHAKIVPKAVGFAKKVGKYYQWSYRKTAYVYGNVKPNHAGDCEYFEGQWLVRGRWGNGGTTGCVRLSNTSWAGVYLKGDRRLIPYPFRFRGVFKGAGGNLGAKSAWVYGRFVKSGAARPTPRPAVPRGALVEWDALG